MTVPLQGTSITLEEMENELKSDQPSSTPKDLKLEGDTIPEALRGRTLEELLAKQDQLTQALQISEAARLALQANERQAAPPPAPAPPPEPEYKPLTREQIQQVYEEDPLRAIEMMHNDALFRAEKHFEQRFGRIEGSVAQSQEVWARQQFPDEFKVLGKEIQELISRIPDKSVFNTQQGWQEAIEYVRGRNFDKFFEFKVNGKTPRTAADARMEQDQDVGFTNRNTNRSTPIPEVDGDLDPTTARIAEVLGLDQKEYKRWAKMGAQA